MDRRNIKDRIRPKNSIFEGKYTCYGRKARSQNRPVTADDRLQTAARFCNGSSFYE